MTLRAAIQALRDDADVWARVADVTGAAAREPEGLKLGESDLSWASRPTGLLDTYEEIRAKVARLLDEGTDNFQSLSRALDKVAVEYEASDENASRKLGGVWDPRR